GRRRTAGRPTAGLLARQVPSRARRRASSPFPVAKSGGLLGWPDNSPSSAVGSTIVNHYGASPSEPQVTDLRGPDWRPPTWSGSPLSARSAARPFRGRGQVVRQCGREMHRFTSARVAKPEFRGVQELARRSLLEGLRPGTVRPTDPARTRA